MRDYKLRCTVTDGSGTTKVSNEWTVDVIDTPPPQGAIVENEKLKQEKFLAKETEKEINSKGFSLEQNYPNPFNPTTRINYTLPQNSYVIIKIYNMLGQEIKTLVQSEMSAGVHAVEWRGDSNNGNVIASGIYIYRLTADKYIISKKMLYLK